MAYANFSHESQIKARYREKYAGVIEELFYRRELELSAVSTNIQRYSYTMRLVSTLFCAMQSTNDWCYLLGAEESTEPLS